MDRYIRSMPFNMIHLCIDDYKDYQITGSFYTTSTTSEIQFSDINDIILEMDKIFNKNGNPQSSQITRSFHKQENIAVYQNKPQLLCQYEDILIHQGKLLTIDIVVKSRRQSSWQGIIFFQDQEIRFSTILDMIKSITIILEKHKF